MCIIDLNPCAPSIHPAVPHECVPHEASYNHVALRPFALSLCEPGFPGRVVVVVNMSERQHICRMTSPYITSCRGSTVRGLESLPRLPSQHGEQSEALFNPAECTSHICLPACITTQPLRLPPSLCCRLPLAPCLFLAHS